MTRRREMAELHRLHRAVWGDAAYESHLAALGQAHVRRRAGATVFVVVVVALALAWVRTVRVGEPSRFSTSSSPTITRPDVSVTTTTIAATTTIRVEATTAIAAPPSPSGRASGPPLANTGADERPLLAAAAVLVTSGIALRVGRLGRRHRRRGSRERVVPCNPMSPCRPRSSGTDRR